MRQTTQKSFLHLVAVVLLQPPPFLRLRSEDEIEHILRDQAKILVVIGARPAVVAAGDELAVAGRGIRCTIIENPVWTPANEHILDRLLKRLLIDLGHDHPSLRLPRASRRPCLIKWFPTCDTLRYGTKERLDASPTSTNVGGTSSKDPRCT